MKLTKGETTTAGSLPHEEVITMTPTEKMLAEFDEVFYEIMGLETDPEGTPDMLLIRDEDDNVLNSISFTPEKKAIKDFLTSKITQALAEERERYTEDINFLKKLHSMELDALSLKSLEDFMKWADDRRHSIQDKLTDKE